MHVLRQREEGPEDLLARNRDIVDETEILIACPGHMHEELRSGTWSTIRYAVKIQRPHIIIWPDGLDSR